MEKSLKNRHKEIERTVKPNLNHIFSGTAIIIMKLYLYSLDTFRSR